MEINHVRFDVVTYNVLIRGFCDSDDLVGALKLYKEMKERGVCPTVNTFCVIIESFCKKIDFPYGEMILDDLCRRGLLFEDEISQRYEDGLRESVSHLPILTDSVILILVLSSLAEVHLSCLNPGGGCGNPVGGRVTHGGGDGLEGPGGQLSIEDT
ncbi:pentatricopeptide repeat-containing protein [Tanacetum coccineum]